jgi:hypothetical protein
MRDMLENEIIIPEHWKSDIVNAESIIEWIFQECGTEAEEVELHALLSALRRVRDKMSYNEDFDMVYKEECLDTTFY